VLKTVETEVQHKAEQLQQHKDKEGFKYDKKSDERFHRFANAYLTTKNTLPSAACFMFVIR
jgi:hypothetical protein